MSKGKIFIYDEGASGKRPEQYRTYLEDGTRGEDFLSGTGMFSFKKSLNLNADDTLVIQSKTEGAGTALNIHRDSPTEGFKLSLPDYIAKDAQIRVGDISFDEKTKQVHYKLYVMDPAEVERENNKQSGLRSRITLDITDDFSANPELFAQAKKGSFEVKGADGKITQKPFNILSSVSVFGSPRDEETGQILRDQVGTFTTSTDPIGYSELLERQKRIIKSISRAAADGQGDPYLQHTTMPVDSRALSDYQTKLAQEQVPAPDDRLSPYWHEFLEKLKNRQLFTSREELQVSNRDTNTTEVTGTERRVVNGMVMEVAVTKTTTDSTGKDTPAADKGTDANADKATETQVSDREAVLKFADGKGRKFANGIEWIGKEDGKLSQHEIATAIAELRSKVPSRTAEIDELYKAATTKGISTDEQFAQLASLIKDSETIASKNTPTPEQNQEANLARVEPKSELVKRLQSGIIAEKGKSALPQHENDGIRGPETGEALLKLGKELGVDFGDLSNEAIAATVEKSDKLKALASKGDEYIAAHTPKKKHHETTRVAKKDVQTNAPAGVEALPEPAAITGLTNEAKQTALNIGAAAKLPTFKDVDGTDKIALTSEDRLKSFKQTLDKYKIEDVAVGTSTSTPTFPKDMVALNTKTGGIGSK